MLQRVARLHAGNYGCAAANDRGENQSAFVNLRIHCEYQQRFYHLFTLFVVVLVNRRRILSAQIQFILHNSNEITSFNRVKYFI